MGNPHLPSSDRLSRLLADSGTQQLLSFLRSDNALIALGVTAREVAWSRFVGWLLDPNIQAGKTSLCFLSVLVEQSLKCISHGKNEYSDAVEHRNVTALLQLIGQRPTAIRAVKVENVEGDAGRSDVVIACEIGSVALTVLIENKIRASEHTDQLRDYVAEHFRRSKPTALLLPVLVQLGDDPAKCATCPWAVCWSRSDVAKWFNEATRRCETAGLTVPLLVRQYLDLFQAWDVAADLRKRHRDTILQVQEQAASSEEWRLLEPWLALQDREFFNQVLQNTTLREALKLHEFDQVTTKGRLKGEHGFLIITKKLWTLPPPGVGAETVNVHIECKGLQSIQLDAEVFPYEGSLGKKQERLKKLAPVLALKAQVHRQLRMALAEDEPLAAWGKASFARLRDPDDPATCKVTRFAKDLLTSISASEYAGLLADIITHISLIVDQELAKLAVTATKRR